MKTAHRNTRQRTAILELLSSTKTHPTAAWLHERLKPAFPGLSLGTVYRNLSILAAQGSILVIESGTGIDRFDADTSEHYHVICRACGRVDDVPVRGTASADGADEPKASGEFARATASTSADRADEHTAADERARTTAGTSNRVGATSSAGASNDTENSSATGDSSSAGASVSPAIRMTPPAISDGDAALATGFAIDGHRLDFFGICPDCLSKGAGKDGSV